jgi:hypothetical protein
VQQALGTRGPARCAFYTDAFFELEAGTSASTGRADCRAAAATLPVIHARIARTSVSRGEAVVVAVASGRTVTFRLVLRRGRWLIDALS